MPNSDGMLTSREICDGAVLERTLADESVGSLKIQKNLQSDNFVTGVSGWEINRDTGSVEFQDATIRGTLNASDITSGTLDASIVTVTNIDASNINTGTLNASVVTVSNIDASNINTGTLNASVVTVSNINASNITTGTLNVSFLDGGTITAEEIILSNSASSILRSANYVSNSAGWRILGNGDAEFNDVEIRGTLSTNTITGNLTMDGTGAIRTDSSGARIEIDQNNIQFYNSAGTNIADLWAGSGGTGTDLVFASTSNGITIEANASSGDALRLRSVSETDLFSVVKTGADAADVTIGNGDLDITSGNLELANGNLTLDGRFNLQDSGVNEWQIYANTSDNLIVADDDGTTRLLIEQGGATTFRNDGGTQLMTMTTDLVNFDVGGQNKVIRVPVKTTTGNPSGTQGDFYLNSSDNALLVYEGGSWRTVASW